MEREDHGLAYMLQYEHVAWYEDGMVRILDRRIYPTKTTYVVCRNYREVAQAITDMVTQSAGPYTAAGMGMALAAYECREKKLTEQMIYLEKAAYVISHARPTTVNRMLQVTEGCLKAAQEAMDKETDVTDAIVERTLASLNRRYRTMEKVGIYLADLFPVGGTILTQCFGETIIGMMLRAAKKNNNPIKVVCAETRPYLQGARLTSSCCQDMGFDTTVITDNMVAYGMEKMGIDVFTSAADTITRDGTIANKIGTHQMALLANHYKIPYYVTGIPDQDKYTREDIVIEYRDSKEVLCYRGIPNTLPGVKAIYPAFDITPPELVRKVVTDKGVYEAKRLEDYFLTTTKEFY